MTSHLLAWLPMVLIGVANGALRETTYGRCLSELRAHQWSTVTALGLLGAYIGAVDHFLPFRSAGESWLIGAVWALATIAFEFVFGRAVARHSWAELWRNYNLAAGRVWILVPLGLGFAPYLFYRLGRG